MFLGRRFEHILRRTTTISKRSAQEAKGRKSKIVLYPRHNSWFAIPGSTEDDFAIYASYQINAGGMFVGLLKVVREMDSRLLFPFESA